jgi:hypothetical protein
MSDDLEALEPSGSSIKYRGEDIEVTPIRVGQVPKLVRKARSAINVVMAMDSIPDANAAGFFDLLMDLTGTHGEEVYEAVAICVGRDPAWIADGDIGEFFDLAKKVFEVNQDFFARRLGPLLAVRAESVTPGDGPTP